MLVKHVNDFDRKKRNAGLDKKGLLLRLHVPAYVILKIDVLNVSHLKIIWHILPLAHD